MGAASRSASALAHFELAVFHDNNDREAEAIPHYAAAIRRGLKGARAVRARAWLASSYWKVGRPDSALQLIGGLHGARMSPELRAWIDRLEGRLTRDRKRYARRAGARAPQTDEVSGARGRVGTRGPP
ncbi:MAG: tetratricopeptide repeat protein [Steroidobacteraceae bacterium]